MNFAPSTQQICHQKIENPQNIYTAKPLPKETFNNSSNVIDHSKETKLVSNSNDILHSVENCACKYHDQLKFPRTETLSSARTTDKEISTVIHKRDTIYDRCTCDYHRMLAIKLKYVIDNLSKTKIIATENLKIKDTTIPKDTEYIMMTTIQKPPINCTNTLWENTFIGDLANNIVESSIKEIFKIKNNHKVFEITRNI